MAQNVFRIDGLHCQGCARTVSAVIGEIATVTSVQVDLGNGGPSTVRVDAEPPLSVAQVREALSGEGDFSVRDA